MYGSRLTLALIENKLREHGIRNIGLNPVQPRQIVHIGPFTVQFIKVNHSISGAYAVAITTGAGTVIFTGDFKIDFTPTDGEPTDLNTFAAYGDRGVLALLADSTNVERAGYTMSERKIAQTFDYHIHSRRQGYNCHVFKQYHRVQQVANCAAQYGRKVCFVGRSMINVSSVAMGLGA